MKQILGIAINTFNESARNKIFYALVVFGLLFAFSGQFLSMVTIGDPARVLKDVGLGAIHAFTIIITIFTGINLIYKEIEKKTIFNILSKPVSRESFILGKFLGLVMTMGLALFAMALLFYTFLWINTGSGDTMVLLYFLMLFFEIMILTALAIFFSSFTTPILSFVFTLSLFLIGHMLWSYHEFKSLITNPISAKLIRLLYLILPNLSKFNIKNDIVSGAPIPAAAITADLLYGVCYIIALLGITEFIFRRKEFN